MRGEPFCVLAGGEIPVRAKKGGKGGRNQHFSAMMMKYLGPLENWAFASIASDGRDYLEGIAGGLVSSKTCEICSAKGTDATHFVEETNTYELHKLLDTHLLCKKGTGMNVSDIYVFMSLG